MPKTFEEILKDKTDSCRLDVGELDDVQSRALEAFTEYQQQFKGKYYEEVEIKSVDDLPTESAPFFYKSKDGTKPFVERHFNLSDDDINFQLKYYTHWLRPIIPPIAEQQEMDGWIKVDDLNGARPSTEVLCWNGQDYIFGWLNCHNEKYNCDAGATILLNVTHYQFLTKP